MRHSQDSAKWDELLLLTANSEWEHDNEKYQRVRMLGKMFGGTLLPKDIREFHSKFFMDAPKFEKFIIVINPNGDEEKYRSLRDAADALNCHTGNLKKLVEKGDLVKRGPLRGYFMYEKVVLNERIDTDKVG